MEKRPKHSSLAAPEWAAFGCFTHPDTDPNAKI